MSLKDIVDGWKNVVFTDEQIELVAEHRLKVCNKCPHNIEMFKIRVCGKCHCPLIAKSRSPESKCPLNLWNDEKEIIKEENMNEHNSRTETS